MSYPLHDFVHIETLSEDDLKRFDKIVEDYKKEGDIPRDIRCRHPFPHEAAHQGNHILVQRWLKAFPHLVHSSRYTDTYGLSVMERIVINIYKDRETILTKFYPEYEHIWRPYHDAGVSTVEEITTPFSFYSIKPYVGHLVALS